MSMVRPTEPLIMFLGINCGGRTTSCWPDATKPMEVGTIVTVIVMRDALQHKTVTDGVVGVAVTGNIMRNTTKKKTSAI